MPSLINSGFTAGGSTLHTTFTYTIPWAQFAGDTLVVNVDCVLYTTAPNLSVSDSKNGSYTSAAGPARDTTASFLNEIQQFFFYNISAQAANANVITFTLSGTGGEYPEIAVMEWSGIKSSTINATGTGTKQVTTGNGAVSITTSNANTLIVTGFCNNNNGWNAAGSGFTIGVNDTTIGNVHDYDIPGATGTYTDTPNPTPSNTAWSSVAAAYLVYGPLAGTASPKVSASGAMTISRLLAGTASPLVSPTVALTITRRLAGSATVQSVISASFQVFQYLITSQVLRVSATGTLNSIWTTFSNQELIFMYYGLSMLISRYVQGQWWNSFQLAQQMQAQVYQQLGVNGVIPDIEWTPTFF